VHFYHIGSASEANFQSEAMTLDASFRKVKDWVREVDENKAQEPFTAFRRGRYYDFIEVTIPADNREYGIYDATKGVLP